MPEANATAVAEFKGFRGGSVKAGIAASSSGTASSASHCSNRSQKEYEEQSESDEYQFEAIEGEKES